MTENNFIFINDDEKPSITQLEKLYHQQYHKLAGYYLLSSSYISEERRNEFEYSKKFSLVLLELKNRIYNTVDIRTHKFFIDSVVFKKFKRINNADDNLLVATILIRLSYICFCEYEFEDAEFIFLIANQYYNVGSSFYEVRARASQGGKAKYSEIRQEVTNLYLANFNEKNKDGKYIYSANKAADEIIKIYESKEKYLVYTRRSLANVISDIRKLHHSF